jgi:fluoride exporter
MEKLAVYLWVGLGSALGGMGRVWLSSVVASRMGDGFPWGTLIVNVSGSFAIGLIAALTGPNGRWAGSSRVSLFLMSGICGGYTTFSAFSLQTLNLVREGYWRQAGMNAIASVALCLVAVWLGYWAGRALSR